MVERVAEALAMELKRLYWNAHRDHLDGDLAIDMAEAALSAFDKERQTPEGWQQIIEQAEHVALGIDCRGPDVTSATSVLIELIRAEADRLLQSTEGQ